MTTNLFLAANLPLAAALLLIALPAGAGELASDSPTEAEILAVVDGVIEEQMRTYEVPGAAFVLVRQGEVVLMRGYGMADLEEGTSVDPETTIFRVGSISKTVTAMAALELVREGSLSLDTDVSPLAAPLELDPPGGRPITLFHLLTHTAGFSERLFGQHAATAATHLSLEDFLARGLPPLTRPPGLAIGYSDFNTALVGLLVERSTGHPFPAAASAFVLEPLGMTSSTFEQDLASSPFEDRLAVAYTRRGSRLEPLARDLVMTTPSAGLFSTAADMARLLEALLNDGRLAGEQIISPSTISAMTGPRFRHLEGSPGRGFGLAEGRQGRRRTLHKDGQCSGFTARLTLLPEIGVGWFSVINLSILGQGGKIEPVARFHRQLSSTLIEELFNRPPDDVDPGGARGPEPVAEVSQRDFAGTYRDLADSRDGWESLLLVNELEIEEDADANPVVFGASPWIEAEPGVFRLGPEGEQEVRFLADSQGRPHYFLFRAGSWEREPWYRTRGFLLRAAGLVIALMLTAPFALLVAKRRGWRCRAAAPLSLAAILLLSCTAVALLALFLVEPQALFSGPPPLLVLAVGGMVLSAVPGSVGLARLLRLPMSPPPRRLHDWLEISYWAAIALSVVAALVLLVSSGLLGVLPWP